MAVTLTEAGAKQIKKLIDDEGNQNLYVRFGVRGGGCSGLRWDLFLDDKPIDQDSDHVFNALDDIKVVVNEICLTYVDGTEIDYVSQLYGGGFKFNNSRIKKSCGCESSFSPEDMEP